MDQRATHVGHEAGLDPLSSAHYPLHTERTDGQTGSVLCVCTACAPPRSSLATWATADLGPAPSQDHHSALGMACLSASSRVRWHHCWEMALPCCPRPGLPSPPPPEKLEANLGSLLPRVLTKCGLLETGMINHFSILALGTP